MADGQSSLYVVAASSQIAKRRVERAVIAGIDSGYLLERLKDPEDTDFVTTVVAETSGNVHIWAIHDTDRLRPLWGRVRPGDWFLFYSRGFFNAVARVAATRDSKHIAEAVWGSVIDGREYRTLVAFDRVEPVDVAAWPLSDFLGSRFLGFRRLADPRQERINDRWGSTADFIEQRFLKPKPGSAKPKPAKKASASSKIAQSPRRRRRGSKT